jgi:hypothetical protein
MEPIELIDILNGIISRFHAKHIWFEIERAHIAMCISSKKNPARAYWCHWPTVDDCISRSVHKKNYLCSNNMFDILNAVYQTMINYPNNESYLLDQNDMKFLEIICLCNSLEELELKLGVLGY